METFNLARRLPPPGKRALAPLEIAAARKLHVPTHSLLFALALCLRELLSPYLSFGASSSCCFFDTSLHLALFSPFSTQLLRSSSRYSPSITCCLTAVCFRLALELPKVTQHYGPQENSGWSVIRCSLVSLNA